MMGHCMWYNGSAFIYVLLIQSLCLCGICFCITTTRECTVAAVTAAVATSVAVTAKTSADAATVAATVDLIYFLIKEIH